MRGVKFRQRTQHENFSIKEDSEVSVLRHYRDLKGTFDSQRSKLFQCSVYTIEIPDITAREC